MSEHRVAVTSEIPDGAGIAVDIGEKRIAIFRYQEVFFALDETCPHRGAPLHEGTIDDGIVICPWHQWQFDLGSGCSPVNRFSRVRTYPVRVEGEDIFVEIAHP